MPFRLVSLPSTSAIVRGLSVSRPESHSSSVTMVFKKLTRAGIGSVNKDVLGHRTCTAVYLRERIPLQYIIFRAVRLIYLERSFKWVSIAREFCLFETTSNSIHLQDVETKTNFSNDESVFKFFPGHPRICSLLRVSGHEIIVLNPVL